MQLIGPDGKTVHLAADDFVAQGGEATVWARDDVAYKVWHDPARVIAGAKLAELARVRHPGVIRPRHLVHDPSGRPVGVSLPYLQDHSPLCRLYPAAYRTREGLDLGAVGALLLQLRSIVAAAHQAGALIVDLNGLNVLVDRSHSHLAVIDVDSWQTPSFPATALADGVRDPHATTFSPASDWFAFAIVSFQLLASIHPFRGQHPTVKSLTERMAADLTVFDPAVRVPPSATLQDIPARWRDWFEAVFTMGDRSEPPSRVDARPTRAPALPTAAVDIGVAFTLPARIEGLAAWGNRAFAWTSTGTTERGRRLGSPPPPGALPLKLRGGGLGFAWVETGAVHARTAAGEPLIGRMIPASTWTGHRGMVHALAHGVVQEVIPSASGFLSSRLACRVGKAARLFRGIVVDSALGSTWLGLLEPGGCRQLRVPGLDGLKVVDAVHEQGVAVLVTHDGSGFTRHVIRSDGAMAFDHRQTPTEDGAARLLVLPTGVAISPVADGLELFHARCGSAGTRAVTLDVALPELHVIDGRPGFATGNRVHTLQLQRASLAQSASRASRTATSNS